MVNLNKLLASTKEIISDQLTSKSKTELINIFKTKLSEIEKECSALTKKCANFEKENTDLRSKLAKLSIPPEFTEYMCALFKRDSSGSYIPIAHCPKCKQPLNSLAPRIAPYICHTSGCSYTVSIQEDLQSIADKLDKTR